MRFLRLKSLKQTKHIQLNNNSMKINHLIWKFLNDCVDRLIHYTPSYTVLGGNCPSWMGIASLGWELPVLGGNCPLWVGIVRLGWELSVLGRSSLYWVGIVRLGRELSVMGGNCLSWVGIFRLGSEFSV